MKCPICGKEVRLEDSETPFCSERCRLIDLGNWASETYKISGPVTSGDKDSSSKGADRLPRVEEDGE